MQTIHPVALFRLSVLGPLASREHLTHGELKPILRELAAVPHQIPGSRRSYLSDKTIEAWYYAWRQGGIEALNPKQRSDAGLSKIAPALQESILQAKLDNPKRSIKRIIWLLENKGLAAKNELKKSSVHRLLQSHGVSNLRPADQPLEEKRRFVAQFANDLWQGDVMHGPKILLSGRWRKTYLVSLMDDASRFLTHSAFHLAEGAVEIEDVLKQAIMRRGLPKKIIIDNGAAYRAHSMQSICARLQIRLVYCRPYHPEGKGKLEKWHRTVRDQFLGELDFKQILSLEDLNARMWAWLERLYHVTPHGGLDGLTPIARYQQDLNRVRPLGSLAHKLDELFYHRHSRKVRKDGTISYEGQAFEVDYELSGKTLVVVVDPHTAQPVSIEDTKGRSLGDITPRDAIANNYRRRCRPRVDREADPDTSMTAVAATDSIVEMAHEQYNASFKPALNPGRKSTRLEEA
jgi:putative transposase